jgi:hypothetical protein
VLEVVEVEEQVLVLADLVEHHQLMERLLAVVVVAVMVFPVPQQDQLVVVVVVLALDLAAVVEEHLAVAVAEEVDHQATLVM